MDSDLNLADEVDFIKKDVNFAVDFIDVSQKLPEKDGRIYINIQTKEKDRFCVELSSSGFKVCLFFHFSSANKRCFQMYFRPALHSIWNILHNAFKKTIQSNCNDKKHENK